jgi:hypothetical protein
VAAGGEEGIGCLAVFFCPVSSAPALVGDKIFLHYGDK